MVDSQDPLRNFNRTKDFFVGIDSDGCVFDTMEVKHKECFIPNIVKFFELAAVAKYARESLADLDDRADVLVCSATPGEALVREWEEHGLAAHVELIAGQEMGSKREHLALAAVGRYDPDKVLMVGDAPGDLKAAEANGVLFFPIRPGSEDESWALLHDEALPRFFAGTYTADYMPDHVARFQALL